MAARAFDLATCARPNILSLKPYRCARDDYKDDGSNVLLDANENAYGPGLDLDAAAPDGLELGGLHRYPDPHQHDLKQLLCELRNTHTHTAKQLTPENLFVGVGSDEAIDALLRCFCAPGRERMLTCPPTYGMYAVSAQVNDVAVVHAPLDPAAGFALQPALINQTLAADPSIKLVYICSPGNPTAARVPKELVQQVLEHPTWNGIVVLDEAYIDFSPEGASLAEWVTEWPNLVVLQTLSKAFGLAGIRLGAAFCAPPVAQLLNNLKAPYNVSSITAQLATRALQPANLAVMRRHREQLLVQRDRLVEQLRTVPGVGRLVGGLDANFVLVEMLDRPAGQPSNDTALRVYERLAEAKGVVVRFRGSEYGCKGCLRITVGTEAEVSRFLEQLRVVLGEVLVSGAAAGEGEKQEANAVVA